MAGKWSYRIQVWIASLNRQNAAGLQGLQEGPVTPRRVLGPSNRFIDTPHAPRRARVQDPFNPSAFHKLNSSIRPGLTSAEFRNLFSRCGACSLVMTRKVFASHQCGEVIDLTTDVED